MIHVESIYIIEYNEKKSYVKELNHDMTGPTVETTVGSPFHAMRFTNKIAAEKIVDMLQYQGRHNARRHAMLVEIKATLEIENNRSEGYR